MRDPFNPLADLTWESVITPPVPGSKMEQAWGLEYRQQERVRQCHHCWHAPRDWQQGSSQIPVPRLCCWCGSTEGPQHGPYAPEGG